MPLGKREQYRLNDRYQALMEIQKRIDELTADIKFCAEREVQGLPWPFHVVVEPHGRPYDRLQAIREAADHYNRLLKDHGLIKEGN